MLNKTMHVDERITTWLQEKDHFLLVGHSGPDGDCLGSLVALQELLLTLGRKPIILLEKAPPREFSFLQGLDRARIWQGEHLPAPDLLVLLDCSGPGRTGDLAPALATLTCPILIIDHHRGEEPAPPGGPVRVRHVDPEAAATAMLVLELFDALGQRPTPAAALGLLTALLTDTFWLQNSNADARALACLARIMADFAPPLGPDRIHDLVCRQNPAGYHGLLALALGRVRREEGLALTWLSQDEIEAAGMDDLETELIMRPLMAVDWVRAGLVVYEKGPGRIKFSLRSRGGGEALALATRLGGGGHREAAGASLEVSREEACRKAVQLWRDLS